MDLNLPYVRPLSLGILFKRVVAHQCLAACAWNFGIPASFAMDLTMFLVKDALLPV
ncbi:MAG: hypothetical protein ACYCPR_08465 [Thermoplasmataceae archaeon]